jgi:hypothetical protein
MPDAECFIRYRAARTAIDGLRSAAIRVRSELQVGLGDESALTQQGSAGDFDPSSVPVTDMNWRLAKPNA